MISGNLRFLEKNRREDLLVVLWMDEIRFAHLEAMVETISFFGIYM